MLKKSLITVFNLILIVSLSYGSASAMEVSNTDLADDNLVIKLVEAKGDFIKEETFNKITPLLNVQVSDSSLGINKAVRSTTSYYFTKGETIRIISLTWNPTGQKVFK